MTLILLIERNCAKRHQFVHVHYVFSFSQNTCFILKCSDREVFLFVLLVMFDFWCQGNFSPKVQGNATRLEARRSGKTLHPPTVGLQLRSELSIVQCWRLI